MHLKAFIDKHMVELELVDGSTLHVGVNDIIAVRPRRKSATGRIDADVVVLDTFDAAKLLGEEPEGAEDVVCI